MAVSFQCVGGFDVVLCRKSASCEPIPLLLSCLFLWHHPGATFVFATVHTFFLQSVNAFIKGYGSKTVTLFLLAYFLRGMKHTFSKHKLVSKSKLRPLPLSSSSSELVWISYSSSKWRFLCSLNGHTSSLHLSWLFGFRIVLPSSSSSPLSCKHISIWYPFLEPHQATYHLYIGVQTRGVTELGTSIYYLEGHYHMLVVDSTWTHIM